MTDKKWKRRERAVAKFFGAQRNPLSGQNSKHTRSDSLHESLYVEVKGRKKHTTITLWDDTKAKADKENKIPVVALCEDNRKGFWLCVHSSDLVAVGECRRRVKEAE